MHHDPQKSPGSPNPPRSFEAALNVGGSGWKTTARTGTTVILAGSVLLGLVSLAMTAAVVGAAGPEHAGVASGILNAARQSGGALGVALLGSLLGSGHALNLHVPLLVAAAGYLIAVVLAASTISERKRSRPAQSTYHSKD